MEEAEAILTKAARMNNVKAPEEIFKDSLQLVSVESFQDVSAISTGVIIYLSSGAVVGSASRKVMVSVLDLRPFCARVAMFFLGLFGYCRFSGFLPQPKRYM